MGLRKKKTAEEVDGPLASEVAAPEPEVTAIVVPATAFDLTGGSYFTRRRERRLTLLAATVSAAAVLTPAGLGAASLLGAQATASEAASIEAAAAAKVRQLVEMTGLGDVTPDEVIAHRHARIEQVKHALVSELDYTRILSDLNEQAPKGVELSNVVVQGNRISGISGGGALRVAGTAQSLAVEQAWEAAVRSLPYITDDQTTYSGAAGTDGKSLTFVTTATLTVDARSERSTLIISELAPATPPPGDEGDQ